MGKLIVIEGGDGSGKATQLGLLKKYCERNNISHAVVDFPVYDSFFGKLISKFLRGEIGKLEETSPYFVSLPFALDRFLIKKDLKKYLEENEVVIANRYTPSNIGHQASKIDNDSERETFITWIEQLEYEVLGMPRPDSVIYLHVPPSISTELVMKKEKRAHLNGKAKDIQEENLDYQRKVEAVYSYLAKNRHNWHTVECAENNKLKTPEDIHTEIVKLIR